MTARSTAAYVVKQFTNRPGPRRVQVLHYCDSLDVAIHRATFSHFCGRDVWIEAKGVRATIRFTRQHCPHGQPVGTCPRCDIDADFAFDAQRERDAFRFR